MNNIWWVNQQDKGPRTHNEVIWSPADDSHEFSWRNMRDAQPGDRVIHYTGTHVVGISTVTSIFVLGPDPSGAHGTEVGKILPVDYQELEDPIHKNTIPLELRLQHAAKSYTYAPFNKNGDLNEGYFYSVKPQLAQELEDILGIELLSDAENTAQRFAIYVPKGGKGNLALGLQQQTGGWKDQVLDVKDNSPLAVSLEQRQEEKRRKLSASEILYFLGTRLIRTPRVKQGQWEDASFERTIEARVTHPLYRDDQELWPDDTYPNRLRFEIVSDSTEAGETINTAALEALRFSANSQGAPIQYEDAPTQRRRAIEILLENPEESIDDNAAKDLAEQLLIDLSDEDAPSEVTLKRVREFAARFKRDNRITRDILQAYDRKCQICDAQISTPSGNIADGAHIKGLGSGHSGADRRDNMLCLCPICHRSFDGAGIIIMDDFSIKRWNTEAEDFKVSGETLTVYKTHNIDIENIRYHRQWALNKVSR